MWSTHVLALGCFQSSVALQRRSDVILRGRGGGGAGGDLNLGQPPSEVWEEEPG